MARKKWKPVGKPSATGSAARDKALKVKQSGMDWKIEPVKVTKWQVFSSPKKK